MMMAPARRGGGQKAPCMVDTLLARPCTASPYRIRNHRVEHISYRGVRFVASSKCLRTSERIPFGFLTGSVEFP